jgi:hypothetical protein
VREELGQARVHSGGEGWGGGGPTEGPEIEEEGRVARGDLWFFCGLLKLVSQCWWGGVGWGGGGGLVGGGVEGRIG